MDSKMSEPQSLTLSVHSADTAVSDTYDATKFINHGTGVQQNHTQAGGHGNGQYNSEHQTFNYHGASPSQGKSHKEDPSKPSKCWIQPWRLPRQAASCYAGYQDVSARLKSCFLETQPEGEQVVFVLSGMGGVGKSESVLQFLKRYNKDLRKE
jgi:hypothetical protein